MFTCTKIGDITINISEVDMTVHDGEPDLRHSVCLIDSVAGSTKFAAMMDLRHSVCMIDSVTGSTEFVIVENEIQAVQMLTEFLEGDGPPFGGLFRSKIFNPDFLP